MSNTSRITAAALAAVISVSMYSCGNKKNKNNSDTTEIISSSSETTTESTDTSETVTTSSEKTTGTATASAETTASQTTTTEAAKTEKPAETEKKADEAPKKGYENSFEAAKAYYNAYITSNADAVYDMFCSEEMEGYHNYISTTELLEGQNAQVAFKRSNVVNAIKQSMQNIHTIMAEKSDVPADKWTTSLSEDLLKPIGENELNDFNKTLNTKFTNAAECGIVYYKDGNDEHNFIGNGCAFVEFDGRWYLSYTTLMKIELITYMDESALFKS